MTTNPVKLTADMLAALFGTLSQHARLITMCSAQDSSLPDTLAAERFLGIEAINASFRFDIDALSISTDVDLNQFIGEEITLRLLQADGSHRAWHGYCTSASWLGADGGVARYRLRLESFLSLLDRRRDSFLFQEMTSLDIATAILAEYPQANFRIDVTRPIAKRAICTQYRETDFAFLARILAAEGLNFRFDHLQDDRMPSNGMQARHQLVIFDNDATVPAMPGGYDTIRFHRSAATEASDAIHAFGVRRAVYSNAVTLSSWHPSQIVAPGAEEASTLEAGELPALELFDGSGERQYASNDEVASQAHMMVQALELNSQSFRGKGSVRQLAAGCRFTLTQHDRFADSGNDFVVLSVQHAAVNNFGPAVARHLASDTSPSSMPEHGTYRNEFVAIRDTMPIVPPAIAQRAKPTATGAQAALVVGIPDSVITSERNHCVKVQFAWQRGTEPMAGGLTETGNLADKTGNAPGDDRSGAWVRVATALAGPNWGAQFTPRIGNEVLVDFIEGDIDRPVVVAQMYNAVDLPPYSAGIDADVNHAGTLSGWHSATLDGSGYNQWVLDDTANQLRMRLASSTAATQLNLGYLIQQAPSSAQRGAYRGSGLELRTDAWGVVRGADGVLLTTSARPQQGSGIEGTQMDAAEAVAQLKGSQALMEALSNAATHQNALHSPDAIEAQRQLQAALDPQQQGKHPAAVNGQPANKTRSDSRDADPTQPVERFASPHVVLDAPASVNLASSASTLLFAGDHLQWSSQADMHWSAGDTLSSVAGEAANLFTHGGGLQAIAANGPVSLQAHTDALELLADQAVTIVSVNDAIAISAKQKIVLQAGQSAVTLEGGDITFACPGTFLVKGAAHAFGGGANVAAELAELPDGSVNNAIPPPAGHPTLDPDIFSQAVALPHFASSWLPFERKDVRALEGRQIIGSNVIEQEAFYTESFTTLTPTSLRYALNLTAPWTIEQSIDVAMPANDQQDHDDDTEND